MKKLIAATALALTLLGSGCRSETELGECHGIFDQDQESPALVYHASTRNIVLGVVFFESIFAPIIAFGFDLYCPVAKK